MKRSLSILLALLMLLSLVACSGNNNDKNNQNDNQNQQDQPNRDLQSSVIDQKEADSYQKNVNIALDGQVTTLDPGLVSNIQHYYLFNMVYNTLLYYDNTAKELSGELAETFEWADDTYTKIHIVLRDGVTFHNGSPLTADDVAFSLDRTTSALVTGAYDHVDVIDARTLDIVLKQPNVDFMYVLSHNSSAIVCKASVEADPDMGGAVGTGPWAIDMANYVAGDTIVLKRNDNYWGEKPKTETLTLRFISNNSSRLIALQNKEASIMTSVNPTEISTAKNSPGLSVYDYTTTQMYYFAFNNTSGPASDNLTLRQAIAYAINREELYMAIGDEGATPATSFYGWHMKYYFDDFDLDLSYNPEKAKELVSQLSNKTLHLMVNTGSSTYRIMSQVIQEQCRQVGLEIIIDEVDSAGATANSKYSSAVHEAMLYSISMNDWDSDMNRLLSVGSNSNKAVLNNERVTELLNLGMSTTDEAARAEYYKELQTIVHDNCFYIPLYYASDTVAYDADASGMHLSYSRDHDYSYICIPEE